MPSIESKITLAASYAHCRTVTRRAGSSFYYPLWLLPREKRRAMYALYAFCRIADDIGDGPGSSEERRARLDAYRESLQRGTPATPELPALLNTLDSYSIPRSRLEEILDGVAMDLTPKRYQSWPELQQYCYLVAGAVGLACLAIWGGDRPEAQSAAIRCGEAFQLTNILRDLRDDAQQRRVYLPQNDLAAASCTEEDLLAGVPSDRMLRLVQSQAARARGAFADSAALLRWLPDDSRAVFSAMWRTYRELLHEIERRQGDVFSQRIRLGRARRLWIVASALRKQPPQDSLAR
jgi:phytoene synthase